MQEHHESLEARPLEDNIGWKNENVSKDETVISILSSDRLSAGGVRNRPRWRAPLGIGNVFQYFGNCEVRPRAAIPCRNSLRNEFDDQRALNVLDILPEMCPWQN